MKLLIRKISVQDAPVIAPTGRQSFYDAFAHLFHRPAELEEYLNRTYTAERIEKSMQNPNNLYFLAEADTVPVGFAKMKIRSFHKIITGDRQSELQRIYVLKDYHGSGAGQGLMNAVLKEARERETDQLWLDVHIGNEKAKRFYEKNGFLKAGDHNFTIGTQLFNYYVMAVPVNNHISKINEYGSSQ